VHHSRADFELETELDRELRRLIFHFHAHFSFVEYYIHLLFL